VSADVHELLDYVRRLDYFPERLEPVASKVIERGANNVKRNARQAVRGSARELYLKHYARSITYDMDGPLAAEIGPDSSKPQGGMGRGVEFGSSDTPPLPHLLRTGEDEGILLEKYLSDASWRALK
jgi:hypothetical protein